MPTDHSPERSQALLADSSAPNGLDRIRELAAAMLAARNAFADRYGDEIRTFREWAVELDAQIRSWSERNEECLARVSEAVSVVLQKLPEWSRNVQTNMVLLERGLHVLEAAGHKSAGYVLSLYEAQEFAEQPVEEVEARLYARTASLEFANAMLELYRSTQLVFALRERT